MYEKIRKDVEYGVMRGSPSLMNEYGVASGKMTLKRFLRSIFLALASGTSYTDGHFTDVTVATSEWHFYAGGDDHPSRMKTMYRFRLPDGEKAEIVMVNKSMFHR